MAVSIISRSAWGAKAWSGTPSLVPLSKRTEFFVHYDGGTPVTRTGNAIPQAIDRTHRAQGWSGIGYNFVISQAGEIFEGRGWNLQGAHCPDHNISGIGVQIAIGGDQEPSAKALAACRALYDEACRKTGRTLAKRGHRDGFATACPGTRLYAWVKAGMPADDHKAAPAPAPSGSTYTVRKGDTLSGIAKAHGTTVKALADANDLADPNRISVGQELKLPGAAPAPAKPSTPTVDLSKLIAAARKNPAQAGTPVTYAGVKTVERALVAEGLLAARYADGHYGTQTITAYKAWQRRCGFTGDDADGIPGMESLTRLGRKHGFKPSA